MIFHLTLKNSSENFLEQSEIRGIINLINNLASLFEKNFAMHISSLYQ